MKIKTKLSLEAILLVSLVALVSLTAVINTKSTQGQFSELSAESIPMLDSLKEMRFASEKISSTTMEILLIQTESSSLISQEEKLESKFYEIENAKETFSIAFTKYFSLVENNFPERISTVDNIAQGWNEMLVSSNELILAKNRNFDSNQIVFYNEQFDTHQTSLENILESNILQATLEISSKQSLVDSISNNTTITVLIVLNAFIGTTIAVRFLMVKSISNPLQKLSNTTKQIALGNFIKTNLDGNDEISSLGKDIDRMSDDLAQLNENIVKSERLSSIGQLASRLAHDLRNPLSIIKNSMAILNVKFDRIMDEKTSLQMARVGKAVDRMTHQIEDVLDYVNVSDLKIETTSLASVIESAHLGVEIPNQIKVFLPKNNVTINCDPYKLESAFCNLIINSVQAIKGDGEIEIKIADSSNHVMIDFTDSGPGIPENLMNKIFEPLFTTKQVGTGLGLPGCKSIIEKHGGTITVSNNPTTFRISLPKEPSSNIRKVNTPSIKRLETDIHD